jgi:hypothetical protein
MDHLRRYPQTTCSPPGEGLNGYAAGGARTCALFANDELKCWGALCASPALEFCSAPVEYPDDWPAPRGRIVGDDETPDSVGPIVYR